MPTYILQKDLPDGKSQDEYGHMEGSCSIYINKIRPGMKLPHFVVENNPEWFKLKEEKIDTTVRSAIDTLLLNGYQVKKDGIEILYGYVFEQKYLEQQAFYAARQYVDSNNKIHFCGGEKFKYLSFEDYLKSLNQ